MMKKYAIYLILILFVFALVTWLSNTKGYNYVLEGSSPNWIGKMEVRPSNSSFFTDSGIDTVYVGTLKKRNNKVIISLQYEANITSTSQQSGKRDKPGFNNNKEIQLFIGVPANDRTVFKKGMSSVELKEIFYNNVTYKITWKDSQGEHTENIILEIKDN